MGLSSGKRVSTRLAKKFTSALQKVREAITLRELFGER